ncbi:MAG TPA: GNAT family N-acetyltransferase [Candidatus Sulfotelmatobacter sp.]|nr:GNAT family N-acetyltransferase [Candidatus Sulfotelmatobacter sp.]
MRAGVQIRPKGERDVDAVVALQGEVAREGRWIATEWPFDVAARVRAQRDALLTRRSVGWIAEDTGTCVGDLTVFGVDADEPELGMVVAASHRGQGIGRALLEAALAWARANGKTALRLAVFPDNDVARALYRIAGFTEIGVKAAAIPRNDGSKRDVVLMRHDLAPPPNH